MTILSIVVITAVILMLLLSGVMMAVKEQFLTQDRWYWTVVIILWYGCAVTIAGIVMYEALSS